VKKPKDTIHWEEDDHDHHHKDKFIIGEKKEMELWLWIFLYIWMMNNEWWEVFITYNHVKSSILLKLSAI